MLDPTCCRLCEEAKAPDPRPSVPNLPYKPAEATGALKDRPLPQSLKQPRSSSGGGRRDGSSRLG